MIAGVARARPAAARRRACSPGCCRGCTRRCWRAPTSIRTPGVPRLHRDGGLAGDGRHARARARASTAASARARRSSTAATPGGPAGPFNYREGKVLSMRELAARERIDLAASYAYSDSESDLPMLRAVGQPVVVNPDADAAPDRLRGGLGGAASRPPRPAPEDARGASAPSPRSAASGAACAALGAVVAQAGRAGSADGPCRLDVPTSGTRQRHAALLGSAGRKMSAHRHRRRSASSSPSPASTATTAARRSSPARCATPAWR